MSERAPKKFMAYYLIAHAGPPLRDPEPLSDAVVVASITTDPRFIGNLNLHKEMAAMAGKMGLVDFEITTADPQDLPGHQLGLPFPPIRRRKT